MSDSDVHHAAVVLGAGRPDDALRMVGAHLAQHPDDANALRVASDALQQLGRHAESLQAAEHAARVEPQSSHSWNTVAFARLASKDVNGAVAAATYAVQLSPHDWTHHANLASIASEQNATSLMAVQAAQEAVRLAPNASEAHQALGLALLRRSDPKRAIPVFERALRLDPHNRLAQHNLAVATLRTGKSASAVASFAHLTADSPTDARTLHNLRISIGNLLGQLHIVVFLGVLAGAQSIRIGRDVVSGSADVMRTILVVVAIAVVVIVAILTVRTRRMLGSALAPVLRFVLARDRLIAAWAVVDGLGLIAVIVGPFLPPETWVLAYGIGGLCVFLGVIFRVVRARIIRTEAASRS